MKDYDIKKNLGHHTKEFKNIIIFIFHYSIETSKIVYQ